MALKVINSETNNVSYCATFNRIEQTLSYYILKENGDKDIAHCQCYQIDQAVETIKYSGVAQSINIIPSYSYKLKF